MTTALENERIETATQQVSAVYGFLTLFRFVCEDEHSCVTLSKFYDLCDVIQQTAKAALDTLSELQDTRGGNAI